MEYVCQCLKEREEVIFGVTLSGTSKKYKLKRNLKRLYEEVFITITKQDSKGGESMGSSSKKPKQVKLQSFF